MGTVAATQRSGLGAAVDRGAGADLSADQLGVIRGVVLARSGIVLDESKGYLVHSRLLPVARALGDDLGGVVRRVAAGEEAVIGEVVDALTTNETSFFRDPTQYEALRAVVFADLATRAGGITVWSAAASSGQEAYSVAMLLTEEHPTVPIQILATDISPNMVARVRAGWYSRLEVNRGLRAAQLVAHFQAEGTGFRVRDDLRRVVVAQAMNLVAPWPELPRMDLILLRNVLIYFDAETRAQVLRRAASLLRPGGYLLLGASENANGIDGLVPMVVDKARLYRKETA